MELPARLTCEYPKESTEGSVSMYVQQHNAVPDAVIPYLIKRSNKCLLIYKKNPEANQSVYNVCCDLVAVNNRVCLTPTYSSG